MFQKSILWVAILFCIHGQAMSLGPIDKFVADRCSNECSSEGPACNDCYSTAVDLFDQAEPVSPELNFDIDDNHGKLEFEF